MKSEKVVLLQSQLGDLEKAAAHLHFSLGRTKGLFGRHDWQPEELERLESLASRFARLSDLLMQRVMRLIDDLELMDSGSLLDRIHRAEKREWVADAMTLVRIRELRNLIAHEYVAEKMAEIYAAVAVLAPDLIAIVGKVIGYARELANKYPGR